MKEKRTAARFGLIEIFLAMGSAFPGVLNRKSIYLCSEKGILQVIIHSRGSDDHDFSVESG
jgi:hypothetical protein